MPVVRVRPTLQALALVLSLAACSPAPPEPAEPADAPIDRPSILLITLDTTRADRLGFESGTDATPNLDALAARGIVFSQAYSTVPTTLPAHASMMTGLYPAEHGVHENARVLASDHPLLAPRLKEQGYLTAAFISGFPLSGHFGLARGFDHYDDDLQGAPERRGAETTDRALGFLEGQDSNPLFLWLHYFDPHEPYDPPEPWRSRYADDPYLGEIAAMDHEIGRLLTAFESRRTPGGVKILVAGDHGEGLGEHGEALHGNLLYQGVMRVPMIVAGTGIETEIRDDPVSIRQISDTVLGWAGSPSASPRNSLFTETRGAVLAEAMKPHLQYGWQPQIMAVHDRLKVIRSGEVEVYDLKADPAENQDLAGQLEIDPELRQAIRTYPLPSADGGEADITLSQADRERLASLGYVDWQGRAPPREDAPSPKDMTHLFADLDLGSGLFVRQQYDEAISVFERVLEQDPQNLTVCLRLAVAHSITGRDRRALELFEKARTIDPGSVDLRHYLAMHHFRAGDYDDAAALFESVLAQMPRRLPALESLARIRAAQGQTAEAIELLERATAVRATPDSLVLLGDLRMASGDTAGAIAAFEQAHDGSDRFERNLELGVLYLADRRFEEARDLLDRVEADHPAYPMALFKRAQVAVLLHEGNREARIRIAYRNGDATTRQLIERESLFRDVAWR